MEKKKHPFEALDDIGFVGISNYKLTPEDLAVFAQKGEEARQRCGVRYGEAQAENQYAAAYR